MMKITRARLVNNGPHVRLKSACCDERPREIRASENLLGVRTNLSFACARHRYKYICSVGTTHTHTMNQVVKCAA